MYGKYCDWGKSTYYFPFKKTPIRDEFFPSTGDGHCGSSSQSWLK
jgi:hypothetical protein